MDKLDEAYQAPAEGTAKKELPGGVPNNTVESNKQSHSGHETKSVDVIVKGRRNRRRRRNKTAMRTKRQRRTSSSRHQLTDEEKSRVSDLLANFESDPHPILSHAHSIVSRDRRKFLLTDEDEADVVSEYGSRITKYRSRFLSAKNPWSYMVTAVRHCVYDYLRRRKFKIHVTFRRRARINSLLENLRLNGAEITHRRSQRAGKIEYELWLTASQAAELRGDPRLESFVVLFDGRDQRSIGLGLEIPDPEPTHDGWQRRHDVLAAYEKLKSELPKPAEVFNLRSLIGEAWETVSKIMHLTIRQCQNLYRKFVKLFKERFPELGEY